MLQHTPHDAVPPTRRERAANVEAIARDGDRMDHLRRTAVVVLQGFRSYYSDADLEDIVQDALLLAMEKCPYRDDRIAYTWVRACVRNQAMTLSKRHRVGRVVEANVQEESEWRVPHTGSAEEETLAHEWREVVAQALRLLPAKHRDALALLGWGWQAEELVNALGASPRGIRIRRERGMNSLRGIIGALERGDYCGAVRRAAASRPRADIEAVDIHLAECDRCRAEVEARSQRWHERARTVAGGGATVAR
jgi:RNA polymerase sigma factor (sigma-70 family)